MLTTNPVQVTILDLLILITLANVGLFAYPFGWQVDAATALNNSKASAIDRNKTVIPHGTNISATFLLSVLFPEAEVYSQDFSITATGQLQIEVLFSKAVNISTVIPGSSLILETPANPNELVTLRWDLNNRFLTIVSNDLFINLCRSGPDCLFTLRLDGTAPNSIRAVDGTLLNDGINDIGRDLLATMDPFYHQKHKEETRIILKEKRKFRIFPVKDTQPEIKVQKRLADHGISFKTHVPFKMTLGYHQVDVLIEALKLIIEIDGDYWHANPKYYEADDIIEGKPAKETWEYDKGITKNLSEQGYTVIRVWECDITKFLEDINKIVGGRI